MGEEKLFGGVVGSVVCKCRGVANIANGDLTKKWRLGSAIKISSRDYVANSISHTQELSTKTVGILWRPGDWMMGLYFNSVLPQSSYIQGRGECLYCAVENAALTGCPEVIACGGGRVSWEALQEALSMAVSSPSAKARAIQQNTATKPRPNSTALIPQRKPVPAKEPVTETVTVLFDYEAQMPGDLSLKVGEAIEIVTRTNDTNQWWVGRSNGKQGQFPGM